MDEGIKVLGPINLGEMLGALGGEEKRECPLKGQDAINALTEAFTRFATRHEFLPGQLVQQKDGLSSYSHGGDVKGGGPPAIFIRYEALPLARLERVETGAPYGIAAVDSLIGWLTPDGGMGVAMVCSQMFEPYPN